MDLLSLFFVSFILAFSARKNAVKSPTGDAFTKLPPNVAVLRMGEDATNFKWALSRGKAEIKMSDSIKSVAVVPAPTLQMPLSILIAVISGSLCGFFNGILVAKLKIPSIILTIGTLTLYRGIAQSLASDFSLGGYPSWFVGIDYRYVGIVPIPVIIFTVFALVVGFILSSTIYGKQLYLIELKWIE